MQTARARVFVLTAGHRDTVFATLVHFKVNGGEDRRVATDEDGKSVFITDDEVPAVKEMAIMPGLALTYVWEVLSWTFQLRWHSKQRDHLCILMFIPPGELDEYL